MKKLIVAILAFGLLLSLGGCGKQEPAPQTPGGWTLSESGEITPEASAAFDKAREGLLGVNYTPLALLGEQLVSGTNYCFLTEAAVVRPDAQPYYAVVTVYEDLQGKAEVRNIVVLDLGTIAETGEIENASAPETPLLGGWNVDRESSIKVDGAVLHLASQTVSGTNHCVLCKGWTLTFVHEDLEGKTEITRTVSLDVAGLSQPTETK